MKFDFNMLNSYITYLVDIGLTPFDLNNLPMKKKKKKKTAFIEETNTDSVDGSANGYLPIVTNSYQ